MSTYVSKVQLFWEGHQVLVNVKTMRTIAQILVAFSEKLNFIKIDLKRPTYDVIDVLIWQQVGWTPQKISVISVIFRPFVTKALVSSPKSMIITGIVQPPHMAAIIPRASKILSWALENRNWNKTIKCNELSRNIRIQFVRESEV